MHQLCHILNLSGPGLKELILLMTYLAAHSVTSPELSLIISFIVPVWNWEQLIWTWSLSLINWFILSEEFFAMIVIWAIEKKDLFVSYQNEIWIDINMKSDQIESRGMTECGVDRFMVCPCILHSNQVNQEPERNLICTKIWVKDRHRQTRIVSKVIIETIVTIFIGIDFFH